MNVQNPFDWAVQRTIAAINVSNKTLSLLRNLLMSPHSLVTLPLYENGADRSLKSLFTFVRTIIWDLIVNDKKLPTIDLIRYTLSSSLHTPVAEGCGLPDCSWSRSTLHRFMCYSCINYAAR